ncbi:unnamed protein product [Orchesella dallaii]|uniref:Uncharacterized protein n=1 Tax=Orchesella dallaii TaxID=48710 RepID=A0ABP1QBX8_9HEXA
MKTSTTTAIPSFRAVGGIDGTIMKHNGEWMPTEDWECNDGCLNEGDYLIYNRNVERVIFVFTRNDEEDVYNTGHAAFTVSPDLTEIWMVYHAVANSTEGTYVLLELKKLIGMRMEPPSSQDLMGTITTITLNLFLVAQLKFNLVVKLLIAS